MNEIAGIILAAVGIFLLITLVFGLMSSGYSENVETAKNYLYDFESKIASADKGSSVDFSLWAPENPNGAKFYLTYFGNKSSFSYGGKDFIYFGKNKNLFCVCFYLDKMVCKQCTSLDYPSSYAEGSYWAITPGVRVKISKGGESYVIQRV